MQSRASGERSSPGDHQGSGWEDQLVVWRQQTPEFSIGAPQYSERLVAVARKRDGLEMFRSSHYARIEWAEARGVAGFDDLKGIYHSLAQIASRAPQRFVEAQGQTINGSLASFFEVIPDTSKERSVVPDIVGDLLVSCLERSPENSRLLVVQCRALVDKVSQCWRELAEIVIPDDVASVAETDLTAAIRREAEELLRQVRELGSDLADSSHREALIEQITKVGGFLRLQLEPLFFENSEIDESKTAAEFWQEAGRIAGRTGVSELTAAAKILERDLVIFVRMMDVLDRIDRQGR